MSTHSIYNTKILFCLIISCLMMFSSCSTTVNLPTKDAFRLNFVGKTYEELIKSLGIPNDLTTSENGEKVLLYNEVTWRRDGTVYRNEYNSVQKTSVPTQGWLKLSLNQEDVCYDYDTNYTGGEVKVKSHGKSLGLGLGLGLGIPVFALFLTALLL